MKLFDLRSGSKSRQNDQITLAWEALNQLRPGDNIDTKLQAAIEALGYHQEGLATRCESVQTSMRHLRDLAGEVEHIFLEFGQLARDHEAKTKALCDREALVADQSERLALQVRQIRDLSQASESAQTSLEARTAAFAKLEERVKAQTDALISAQLDANMTAERLKAAEVEISRLSVSEETARGEVIDLKCRLEAASRAVAEAGLSVATKADSLELKTRECAFLQSQLDARTADISEYTRRILTLEGEQHRLSEEVHTLQGRLSEAQADSIRASAVANDQKVELTGQVAQLRQDLAAAHESLAHSEALLRQSREAAHASEGKVLELEALRPRLASTLSALDTLCAQVEDKAKSIQESDRRYGELKVDFERLQAAHDQVANARDQALAEVEAMRSAADAQRLEAASELEALKAELAQLREHASKERQNLTFVEGALRTARKDRAQLQDIVARARRTEASLPFTVVTDANSQSA